MNYNMFDGKSFKEFVENNMNFIDSFFDDNSFNENFIENVRNNNISSEKSIKNDNNKHKNIPFDVIKKNNEIICIFEIPGLNSKDDVMIKYLGSTLIIEGEILRNYQSSTKEITNYQRIIGHFSKKVNLPYVIDIKRINAKYKSGLLEVRLPIIKENNSDNIDINFFRD